MTPTATGPALDVEGVAFEYQRNPVLDGVTFRVAPGELVALTGPNGSGKTTLLRVVLGLLPPSQGSVRLFGDPPRHVRERGRIGYVPQIRARAELLPATVRDVVTSGRLARRGWWRPAGTADRRAVDDALHLVGLDDLADRRLATLSGGQQQRAFIAKALVTAPELLILDEPTTGIDAESHRRFRDTLVTAAHQHGTAVLLVSHDLGAVADDLDRVVLLRHGHVVFDGPPVGLTASGVSLGVHGTDLPVWLERLG